MQEKIRTIIVDDEEDSREVLEMMVKKFCPDVDVCGTAHDVLSAVELIKEQDPDVVFLDIEMPQGNGFNLFYYFEKISFEVVFTTAYSQYAIKALRMAALDYLLKPIDLQELKTSLNRYREKYLNSDSKEKEDQRVDLLKSQYKSEPDRIAIPVHDGFRVVRLDQIMRLQADGSYTQFTLEDGEQVLVSKILKEYDELLTEYDNFLRIHRSHLINTKFITKIIRSKHPIIVMKDDTHITISSSKKDAIFKDLLSS